MKKLTVDQLVAIQDLEENSLIAKVDIEFQKGLSRIIITSIVGTSQSEVDSVLNEALGDVFPGLEYMGSPAKYTNPIDGINQELYYLNYEGETLFYLIMRLGHEWSALDIVRQDA